MKNLLAISLDTWRHDYVNKVLTPNIVSLLPYASRDCYTTATWTLPAHASLFTGLLPIQHGRRVPYPDSVRQQVRAGVITDEQARKDFEAWAKVPMPRTFAEVLRDRDYNSLLFAREIWFMPEYGLHKGFDGFITRAGEETDPLVSVAGEFPPLVEPWFLFLHTFTTHNYLREEDCPDESIRLRFMDTALRDQIYQQMKAQGNLLPMMREITDDGHDCSKLEEADFEILRALYKGHLSYTDHLIGRVLARVNPEVTDVVVFGDHGEALGDYSMGRRNWHHRSACPHEALVKVPVRANFPLPGGPYSLKGLLMDWWLDYTFDEPAIEPAHHDIFCEAFSYRDHSYNLVRVLDGSYRINKPTDMQLYDTLKGGG